MKFFRIFTFSAGFLILLYICIGLLSPRTTYSTSLLVEKPDSTTFRMFTDTGNYRYYISSFRSVEHVSGNGVEKGSQYRLLFHGESDNYFLLQTITEVVENKYFAFTYENHMMTSENYVIFSEKAAGLTEVSIKTSIQGKGLITRSMFPIIKSKMIKQSMAEYRKLKSYIEKNSKTPPTRS